jgi:hypothetical protein
MSRFNRGCGCDRDRVGGVFDRHDRDVGGVFDRDRCDRDRVGGAFDRDRDCDFVGGRRRKNCICFLVEPITNTLRCIFCGCNRRFD